MWARSPHPEHPEDSLNPESSVSASAHTRVALTLFAASVAAACAGDAGGEGGAAADSDRAETSAVARAPLPEERRFASLTQLTFEGENAEAYY